MRSAPNNSFNPTPHRGAGRVLCATLARVRRPAKGRLNSGVRPQMNQPGSAQRSLGLLQTFFVGLASFAGASSSANVRAGKREVTAMMLATLFSFYAVCIEIFLHDHYGASILGWIRDLWPWQSDNSRSFKIRLCFRSGGMVAFVRVLVAPRSHMRVPHFATSA